MKAEGGRMKEMLLKMSDSSLNSMPFILPPSSFRLALVDRTDAALYDSFPGQDERDRDYSSL